MITEAAEVMEKLKDKRAKYEPIASSDSSINPNEIDSRIIIEVLGPESSQQYMPLGNQAQVEV
ncbi:hypothetical protein Gotur_028631 [Gossypium turneri]